VKVALAWNWPSRLLDCSFRFEQYVAGLAALGHQPVLVCTPESADGFIGEFHLCHDRAQLRDPAFWREVGADAVLLVTWNRMAEELQAIRDAGSRPIALTDTDGRAGSKRFWAYHLERQILYLPPGAERRRFFRRWLLLQVRQRFWRHFPEDLESVRSTAASDVVAVGHEGSRRNLTLFLESMGQGHLAERIRVVPFTIGASFLTCPLPDAKEDRVVAIGRWDDPQKDAGLLAAALARFCARRPQTQVDLYGGGGEQAFAALGRDFPSCRYHGVQRQEVVAEALSQARSIVFSSRWEGCPHAALEAMALGATVVGTPIASLASWTEEAGNGRVGRATPRGLANALEVEMTDWDAGRRDPHAQATRWRERVKPETVCARLLEP
jgi:glycosyltransferase involved in cell wall biosynthesis